MERLIQASGQPHYGVFPSAPGEVNWRDFDFRSPMGRRLGALAKWRRYHQFQYFGLVSNELIGGCALANLSLLGVGFVYLFHPASGRLIERQFRRPLGLGCEFSPRPNEGVCQLRSGENLLRLENHGEDKHLKVSLDDGMQIEASFSEARFQPMSLCTPSAANGWVYAQKVAGARCIGQVRSRLGDFDLRELDAFAHHDWSAGYMRPETNWNWACLSGEVEGVRVGLNLSCGVNETSFSENCLWLDGELLPVSGAHFQFDRDDPLKPWVIRSSDGQVELNFRGIGLHREKLNLGILASNFKQVFGCFSGRLQPAGRAALQFDNLWGFVEEQYVKW